MSTIEVAAPTMNRHLHIVLDEDTYQRLRTAAFARQTSIGDVVRQALVAYLGCASEQTPAPPPEASDTAETEGR